MNKVTIITPVLNLVKNKRMKSFKKCLQSVHDQSYKNIEHIVIDGASTDGTLAFIKPYVDKGWIQCYSQKDTGIYDAFNKGIKRASGQYINFMNSDDSFACSDAVETLVACLEENDADYVYADANVCSQGRQLWVFNDNIEKFWERMPFCHQTMFVKKELFEKIGYFNTSYRLASDYEWILKLILDDYRPAYVPRVLVNFSGEGATIKEQELSRKEQANIYMKIYKPFYQFKNESEAQSVILAQNVSSAFLRSLSLFLESKNLFYVPMNRIRNYIRFLMSLHKNVECQLLNFIPLFRYINQLGKRSLSVLGLNIFKLKWSGTKYKLSIFHFIPIIYMKRKKNKRKYYLFKFIPLLSVIES